MQYYISDLHFFCRSQTNEGAVNYDGRPYNTVEEMNRDLLSRWNRKVTNADTVYILGDLAFRGKNDALIAQVAQLKGKKVLIKGNHDDLSDLRYKQLFTGIFERKEVTDCFGGKAYKLVLDHFPILMWAGQHKGVILLYGHTHNSAEETFFQKCLAEMNASEELSLRRHGGQKIQAFNVGAMMPYMGYEPRTLREIMEHTNPCFGGKTH